MRLRFVAPFIVLHAAALLALPPSSGAADVAPDGKSPQAFIERYCVGCHGPAKQKGGVRLDTLKADFSHVGDAETWLGVMDQLNASKMPPKGKPRPTQKEVEGINGWIAQGLRKAEEGRSEARLRRLSKYEYTRTLEDLLGILYFPPDDFPPDPGQHGFDNNPDALTISPDHLQKFVAVADEALDVALGFTYRAPGSAPKHVFDPGEEAWRHALGRHEWDVQGRKMNRAILTPGQAADMNRNLWHTGMQTIRATVAALPGSKYGFPPRLVVTMNTRRLFDIEVNGTLERPQQVEFHFFDRGHDMRFEMSNGALLPTGEADGQPHKLNDVDLKKYRATVPCLVVDHIEVDGNDIEPWPPASRSRIFFKGEKEPPTPAYAREIVAGFMARAYRRPVTDKEVERIFAIVRKELDAGSRFDAAIKLGLRAVLCSPKFLFLVEQPQHDSKKLAGRELACRLSYFLWASMPDDELCRLADDKRIFQPEVLRAQVDRLLVAPRGDALKEKFCVGWLQLDKVGSFTPDRFVYPQFEQTLQTAMVDETKAYFSMILRDDLDIRQFIRSDWAALNERMARHYQIAGVKGDTFRKVSLPPGSKRGGLLTQASILTLTSDGLRTKPVTRGKWILDNILGTPPPPPPPNAGQLPNIPEFSRLSIREQLRRHREIESCAACHAKIDPLGFVLENYDAIGSWRDHYIVADPKLPKHTVTGFEPDSQLIAWAHEGIKLEIDRHGKLPDATVLGSIEDLQDALLAREELFLKCLTEKLFVYGMGRRVRFSDRPAIDELAKKLTAHKTLRGLIKDLVCSETFQSR